MKQTGFQIVNRPMMSVLMVLFLLAVSSADIHARSTAKPSSKTAAAQENIDKAWAALDEEMTLKNLDVAIKHLEKAVKLDPKNPDLLVELSQEYFWRGDLMPQGGKKEKRARDAWFKKGMDTAEKSLEIKETPGGHYWFASNLVIMKKGGSVLAMAAAFPGIMRHMEWVEKHDRNYNYGAAAFYWARVVVEAPSTVVKLVGQDPERIYKEMEISIAFERRYIKSHVFKAMFYNDMGKKKEALEILDEALKMDPAALPNEKAMNRYSLKLGRKLWKEWTGEDYPEPEPDN
ncbi:tetratricopeptide repeat protein [bacterium]